MPEIYTMKLGEIIKFAYMEVTRVPGGWIFFSGNGDTSCMVFVPFNNEFMPETVQS